MTPRRNAIRPGGVGRAVVHEETERSHDVSVRAVAVARWWGRG